MLCGLLLLPGTSDLRAQSYTVTDLGTLGGSLGSAANVINSYGQVVGYAFTTDTTSPYTRPSFIGTGLGNIDLGTFFSWPLISNSLHGLRADLFRPTRIGMNIEETIINCLPDRACRPQFAARLVVRQVRLRVLSPTIG